MSANVFLEGGESFLQEAKKLGLTNKMFLACDLNIPAIDAAKNDGFFGISASTEKLQVEADVIHKKDLYLMIYSPNNYKQNQEALKIKPDIIQTDDPISILKLLKRYNYDYAVP